MLDASKAETLAILQDAGIGRRAAKVLMSCPEAGEGCHPWIFKAAIYLLREERLTEDRIEQLIREHLIRPEKPANEIESALHSAKRALSGEAVERRTPKAKRVLPLIATVSKNGPDSAALMGASPCDVQGKKAEDFLTALFPGNPLICCGYDVARPVTMQLSELVGTASQMQFVVPSPMSAAKGMTLSGRSSPRCNDNTGPRTYLVTEFDFKPDAEETRRLQSVTGKETTQDLCASLIWHLRRFAPLAMVVHSGGKSLHAWWHCKNAPSANVEKFFQEAVKLGADPKTWTPSQFVRMPDGQRRNNGIIKPQPVLYWDDTKTETAYL